MSAVKVMEEHATSRTRDAENQNKTCVHMFLLASC